MKEKIVENTGLGFHGECVIIRADIVGETLPDDAKKIEPDEKNRLLVAHSESGHHHYVDGDQAVLYETSNPLVKFLEVEMDSHALLKHAKPEGDPQRHTTQKISGGLHKVIIQREYTPDGWRAVQD